MAKNREPEKTTRPEPVPDEEDEEEEDSSEEEEEEEGEESGSDSEQTQTSLKQPTLLQKRAPGSSSEEEGSGSETESEEQTRVVTPSPQKPVQKPISKKTSAKEISSFTDNHAPAEQKTAGGKRLVEEKGTFEVKEVKKAKKADPAISQDTKSSKKQPEPSTDPKKQQFQRVWSEESEIVILEGMMEFMEEKNADPTSQLDAFHAFIKKKINIDVSRSQLQNKIRRIKDKYKNSKKNTDDGEDPVFIKPHEQKAYDLSKKIWGDGDWKSSVTRSKSSGPVVKKAQMKQENSTVVHEIGVDIPQKQNVNSVEVPMPRGCSSSLTLLDMLEHEKILSIGSEIFEGEKKVEGTKEWKMLRLEALKVHLKRLGIMSQQTKLVLDTLEPKTV